MRQENFALPRTFVAMLAALLPLVGACDVLDSEGDARVQLHLTDAPTDFIESAQVWISAVYLQGGPGDDDDGEEEDDTPRGRVYLFEDAENPFQVDLLVLQDGLVATLTEAVAIPAGDYDKVRLVVDSSLVTLKEGYTFPDGESTGVFKIPSNRVMVMLDGPIAAQEGETTEVVLDFDVDKSFVITGNPNVPDGVVKGLLFKPVIKETERSQEAS